MNQTKETAEIALGHSDDDDYEDDEFDQPGDQDTPPTAIKPSATMARQTSPIIGKEDSKGYYENLDESQNLVQK